MSADGRHVAFQSDASNLVAGDTNQRIDIFVRDVVAGTTRRVSLASDGTEGGGHSERPSISADGRFVVFESRSSNFVPGDTNAVSDVFVHEIATGITERVSVASDGSQGNGFSIFSHISADGRFVSFRSAASNLVPGDTNLADDVFVHDRWTGITTRESLAWDGAQANQGSAESFLSADGRYLVFRSGSTNLVPGDTNQRLDVFLRDRLTGTIERVSIAGDGTQSDGHSSLPSVSADGRHVAFLSTGTTLVPGDTNQRTDVFLRDRAAGTTRRVSVASDGLEADHHSDNPILSSDGRFIAFWSFSTNLVPGDSNAKADVFVRDEQLGLTRRVSLCFDASEANGDSGRPAISADGLHVAFDSFATNLVPADGNGFEEVFLRSPSWLRYCAGDGSGNACPCGNAGAPEHGCSNSTFASGCGLDATGEARTGADSLVLRVAGSVPGQPGLFFQGNSSTALGGGAHFGDGLRCAGGGVVRLQVRTADGAGEASSTVPIALKGGVSAGETRRYQWWHRDPGASPCGSGFNLSNGLIVFWSE